MKLVPELVADHEELTAWRRELHAHPQTAFEETFASAFVAERLEHWGWRVETGWATTGVVGVLEGRRPAHGPVKNLGLRADIDALDIDERNDVPYRSQFPGKMHACGHDGHTTMLLAAARHLARTRAFDGTVTVIFQPAEENEGGAEVMVREGLFEQHPIDEIYGLHNWPGLPVGRMAALEGPVMASFDRLEITLTGRGGHAAMPHLAHDPIVAASQLVTALQTVVSRSNNPVDALVLSIAQIDAGHTWNVLPESARLRGTVRAFRSEVQDLAEHRIRTLAAGVAQAFEMQAEVTYQRSYPATINTREPTHTARRAAAAVVGDSAVLADPAPSLGAEDFAFMLRQRPGCYIWLGAGGRLPEQALHSPRYDFNDAILPIGASYWVRLVETVLGGTD